jgi:hypothetical protein
LAARPHEEDWRRAISAAYSGLFHFTLTAAADLVVGADERSSARYSLVYRSVDHSRLRTLCSQLSGTKPQNLPLVPSGGFGTIADFARIAGNLYELRNLADYDPSRNFTPDEAKLAISDARQAITWFQQGTKEQQEVFLTLLLFKSR